MNGSAFASIMLLIVFAFVGAMVFIFKKNNVDNEEERTIEHQNLNDFDATVKSISHVKGLSEEEKQKVSAKEAAEKQKADFKFKSDNPIKEIQAKNHMRKSPADEYFERMKQAAAEIIKPKS